MPSGGHSRSGPAPDPTSLRSAAAGSAGGWTAMTDPPATAPAWPLGTPTPAEAAAWSDLWTTRPAASLWDRYGLARDAALYVRTLLAFEMSAHSNAALGGLAQRMADQLGLTVAGAARNRWTFPSPARAGLTVLPDAGRPSARERLAQHTATRTATPTTTNDEDTSA